MDNMLIRSISILNKQHEERVSSVREAFLALDEATLLLQDALEKNGIDRAELAAQVAAESKVDGIVLESANESFGTHETKISSGVDLLTIATRCAQFLNDGEQPNIPKDILATFATANGRTAFTEKTLHMLGDLLCGDGSGASGTVSRRLAGVTVKSYFYQDTFLCEGTVDVFGKNSYVITVREGIDDNNLNKRRPSNPDCPPTSRVTCKFPDEFLP